MHSDEEMKKNHVKPRRKSESRKPYQVKGAHEKSYLDISQLRFSLKDESDSESPHSDSTCESNENTRKSMSQMVSHTSNPNVDSRGSSFFSGNSLQSPPEEPPKVTFKITGKFIKTMETPKIFQGKYKLQSISDIDMGGKKHSQVSQMSITSMKGNVIEVSKRPSKIQTKYKYIVETQNIKGPNKRRGYYSETVSPLLRPEKIIAARQKEMEELRRFAIEKEEGEGEEEEVVEGARKAEGAERKPFLGEEEEFGEDDEVKLETGTKRA